MQLNYEITNRLTFPFIYGVQHLKIAFSKRDLNWRGRVVHLITGFSEMLPIINYIIAIADRILHPKWLWDLIGSQADFDRLPEYDQSSIKFSEDEISLPGIGIGICDEECFQGMLKNFMTMPDYKWFEVLEKDDHVYWNKIIRKRNEIIINRMGKHHFMKGIDVEGNPLLLISRPTTRSEKKISNLSGGLVKKFVGNEVSIIFNSGVLISVFRDNLGDCSSKISRFPEKSPGLVDFARKELLCET